jgi:hypothetical protein
MIQVLSQIRNAIAFGFPKYGMKDFYFMKTFSHSPDGTNLAAGLSYIHTLSYFNVILVFWRWFLWILKFSLLPQL